LTPASAPIFDSVRGKEGLGFWGIGIGKIRIRITSACAGVAQSRHGYASPTILPVLVKPKMSISYGLTPPHAAWSQSYRTLNELQAK
jgi:hypothetical protein